MREPDSESPGFGAYEDLFILEFGRGGVACRFPQLSLRIRYREKGIHPDNYREVVFRDVTTDTEWITRSTAKTDKTTEIDGKKYPLYDLAILPTRTPSTPAKRKLVDAVGRVERFNKKYRRKSAE